MSENEMNGELTGTPRVPIYLRVSSEGQEHLREDVSAGSSAGSPEGMTELQYQVECVTRYAAEAGCKVVRAYLDTGETAPETPDAA